MGADRVLVRAGAMGAWTPAEIWQLVPCARLDEVQYYYINTVKCSKNR